MSKYLMRASDIPRALRGRVQPLLTIEQVRKQIAYDRALNPPRQRVSADEFEQIVYDAIARDASASSAQIVAWVRKAYEVSDVNA